MTNEIKIKENIVSKLIDLSKIFKDGFTVVIDKGDIRQYNNKTYKYIVAVHNLVIIDKNTTPNRITIQGQVSNSSKNLVVGGWMDIETGKYYIALNEIFMNMAPAMDRAKQLGEKYIYDFKAGGVVKVE